MTQARSLRGSCHLSTNDTKELWEHSFTQQIAQQAYNTAAVEAVIRCVAYYLRDRDPEAKQRGKLKFLEMGCGAGANLVWLARQGLRVSGLDHSSVALALASEQISQAGYSDQIDQLIEASVSDVPFADETFDGIIEACVFQHLAKPERLRAFQEVKRLLKPGGLFVGYLLDVKHSLYEAKRVEELKEDTGTLTMREGGHSFYLNNLGLCHFFKKEEILQLLRGFSCVDPCLTTYELPRMEAEKRGYPTYLQSMWAVYAIK